MPHHYALFHNRYWNLAKVSYSELCKNQLWNGNESCVSLQMYWLRHSNSAPSRNHLHVSLFCISKCPESVWMTDIFISVCTFGHFCSVHLQPCRCWLLRVCHPEPWRRQSHLCLWCQNWNPDINCLVQRRQVSKPGGETQDIHYSGKPDYKNYKIHGPIHVIIRTIRTLSVLFLRFYLFGRQRDLPSSGSLTKWLQQPGPSQAKTRNTHPGLPPEWQ